MIFEASVDELAFQFSARNEEPHPIVLLGAGASITSGVPSAHMSTIEIVKWAYAREILKITPDRANIRKSQWERYLQQQPWYRKVNSYAELYPDAVEKLLVPREFRRQVLSAILKDKCQPSKGYRALADLCQRHLVYHFLTTNFDPTLEESLLQKRLHIREVTTVNKSAGDFEAFSPHRKAPVSLSSWNS
jgi:NAD-dependent SIR2 family protein deacetylase